MLEQVKAKASKWLESNIDENSKKEIRTLLESQNPDPLIDAFYKDLEFGTGGLRGVMGAGSNRMNKYTLGMATQGLSNYLKKSFPDKQVKVALAYDCRNSSQFFAETAANIFSANGIKVYLFKNLRPTPLLSFAIRHLGCQSGVVITASHNPKIYNGYKAYWEDGAQVTDPHDQNIVDEVAKIKSPDEVNFNKNDSLIEILGADFDQIYLKALRGLSLNPEAIKAHHDIPIVFSSIHGTAITLVPQCMKEWGFTNFQTVTEQDEPDGNFPTVIFPNPEEKEALSMALKKAEAIGAALVTASDPDGDRVGIAVRDHQNNLVLLNGNQTGAILAWYILSQLKEKGKLQPKHFIAKTIVTSNLFDSIAESYGVKCYNTLTGFKYIATVIREKEGEEQFIFGAEESYGYMIGDFVRDKDAVSAIAMISEVAAYAKQEGTTLYGILQKIYLDHGLYKEALTSLTKEGKKGADEITRIMEDFRTNPPKTLGGAGVASLLDYQRGIGRDLASGKEYQLDFPKSNVLQFITEDGSKISLRPSGTEPKIKFYFSVNTRVNDLNNLATAEKQLDEKLAQLKKDLKL